VQISVVVAIIQTRYISLYKISPVKYKEGIALKAVVEKVSLRLAIMQRLVGPKYQVKTI